MFDIVAVQSVLVAALQLQRQTLNAPVSPAASRAQTPTPPCDYCGTRPWAGERRCEGCGAPVPFAPPPQIGSQVYHNRIYGVSPLYPELSCRVKA